MMQRITFKSLGMKGCVPCRLDCLGLLLETAASCGIRIARPSNLYIRLLSIFLITRALLMFLYIGLRQYWLMFCYHSICIWRKSFSGRPPRTDLESPLLPQEGKELLQVDSALQTSEFHYFNRMVQVYHGYEMCGKPLPVRVAPERDGKKEPTHCIYTVHPSVHAMVAMIGITKRAYFEQTMGVVLDPTENSTINDLHSTLQKQERGCAIAIMLPSYSAMYKALENIAHASASRQSLRFAHNLDHWFRSVFYGQFSEVHMVFVEDKEICFSNSNAWIQIYYCGELIRCAEMSNTAWC